MCKACKFYKAETGSCGTLIVGQTVTHYRNKVKLCGCVMKWKAKYRFSSCPIGKWDSVNVSKQDIEHIAEFIHSIKSKPTITAEENAKLFRYISKVTGVHQPPSGCGSCVKSAITDLLKEVNRLNQTQESNP
jgi:hypothetical protein